MPKVQQKPTTAIKAGPRVGHVNSSGAGMRGESKTVRDAYDKIANGGKK